MKRLTDSEKKWILYNVANSAFVLLVATIIPIYFNALADNGGLSSVDYLAYWGYAASIATLVVAVLGPVIGSASDRKGRKKTFFCITVAMGALFCLCLGFVHNWLCFLAIFIFAKVAYSLSLILYDSMLIDITDIDHMDNVSSQGYAWGYIGSCIPFAVCLILVLFSDKIGLSMDAAMVISFIIIAAWWFILTLPLLTVYEQKHYMLKNEKNKSFISELGTSFRDIAKEKKILLFLVAFFFYIDGVYTIIDMATAYGSALGLDTTGLLLALLVTQIVAFPFSVLFGILSKRFSAAKLICVCIVGYFFIVMLAVFMTSQLHFWILAVSVGMFQGGIQALSRSYFAKIIPADKSGEYFGIYDIFGKGASFMGTTAVSIVSQISGRVNFGVLSLAIFFIIGIIFFILSSKSGKENFRE